MPPISNPELVESIEKVLIDETRPLKERFRALFTLKNIGGKAAIDGISKCFKDPSALLKHECAYCLGQMQDEYAIPTLVDILKDTAEDPMVRHEAGEALGAIGSLSVLPLLTEYATDPVIEVAETCQLAAQRIEWLHNPDSKSEKLSSNPFDSVDPAPPCEETSVQNLQEVLQDENLPLFKRYRAMFSLRNRGDTEAVLALAEGLKCGSALFRHEVAYVLGQMQHPSGADQLKVNLMDKSESAMVRHECAEALGAIATEKCMEVLAEYAKDSERVVRESCEVALDMCEYETSGQFQYADGLSQVTETNGS